MQLDSIPTSSLGTPTVYVIVVYSCVPRNGDGVDVPLQRLEDVETAPGGTLCRYRVVYIHDVYLGRYMYIPYIHGKHLQAAATFKMYTAHSMTT